MPVLLKPMEEFRETDPRTNPPKFWRWKKIAVIAVVAIVVVVFYASGVSGYLSWDAVRSNLDEWLRIVRGNLLVAALIFFLAYFAVTALSLPVAAVLSLAAVRSSDAGSGLASSVWRRRWVRRRPF